MTEQEREIDTQLKSLRRLGYMFLCTSDDGDTWTGSNDLGLPLEMLIHNRSFRGHIVYPPTVPDMAQSAD